MHGPLLILMLAIAGGVIAYAGDRIGMKVGRKRLSMFGLRPKYTSMIVTIVTGVVIAGCSILLLSLASENVRIALFELKEIQSALSTARSDLDAKRAEVDDLSKQVEQMAKDRNMLQAEFDQAVEELAKVSKEREHALGELALVQSKLKESEKKVSEASARLKDVEASYGRTSSQLAEAVRDLGFARKEIASLEDEQRIQRERVAALTETRDRLELDVSKLQRDLTETTQRSAQILWEAGQLSMWGKIIFRADEVVLGSVVDCSPTVGSVQDQVNAFLLKVNDIAQSRGARSSRNDGDPFVLNFEEANVLSAFQRIDETSGKVVLRAISPVNTWNGEPLAVSLHVYPDKQIFEAGQVIASATIDGAQGADRVQESLLFLVQGVNSTLIAEGMPSDEEGKVGTLLSVSEFASAIAGIANRRTPVVVQAVAETDIWRAQKAASIKLVIKPQ